MPNFQINDLKISANCPHCHTPSLITIVDNNVQWEIRRNCGIRALCIYKVINVEDYWWIGECHNCNELIFVLNYGTRIYPQSLPTPSDERIPDVIREDLDEAKMCLSVNCYRASAVLSRRALQACCIEKDANGNNSLIKQIEELCTNGVITKHMKDWADTIRWIGNDAAHINANKVNEEDAEEILKLTEQLFHIIYIAPAIAKERLAKRKQSKSGKPP